MFSLRSSFIGSFKLGDNINHNLAILKILYEQFDNGNEEEKRLLCKPVILILVSIIEALLHDFYFRIDSHTIEGIKNLGSSIINQIRGKQIDQLQKYIASARKHELFGKSSSGIYDDLDKLRRLRNRIHIQNLKDFEINEYDAFTEKRKILAERTLEKIMRILAKKHSRNHHYVEDFTLPWNAYFT